MTEIEHSLQAKAEYVSRFQKKLSDIIDCLNSAICKARAYGVVLSRKTNRNGSEEELASRVEEVLKPFNLDPFLNDLIQLNAVVFEKIGKHEFEKFAQSGYGLTEYLLRNE